MQLFRYQRSDGSEPFTEWLNGVGDKATQARIRVRVRVQRLAAGNPGDVKPVGGGVSELRFQFGAGYRIYLSQQGATWILPLSGETNPANNGISPRRRGISRTGKRGKNEESHRIPS